MLRTDSAPSSETARSADRGPYRGWLLRTFPHASQPSIVARSILIALVIIAVEYVLEVVVLDLPYWQRQGSFLLGDPGVPLSAVALVFSLVLLGQWGGRYLHLWATVRPAFDVPDDRYDRVVQTGLEALYNRDHVPFLGFVVVQLGVYAMLGPELPAGFVHIGFLHFFAVAAVYSFYRHTRVISRLGRMQLESIARARPILSEIADFSVFVCMNWFAALAVVVVYVGLFLGLDRTLGVFYALTVLVLVAVGLLVFVVPLVLLHETLARAKRDQLAAIDEDVDGLFEAWREGDLDEDPTVGLEILQTRRQNVKSLSTWPYRMVSVGKLALGSVVPAALSILQTVR